MLHISEYNPFESGKKQIVRQHKFQVFPVVTDSSQIILQERGDIERVISIFRSHFIGDQTTVLYGGSKSVITSSVTSFSLAV